MLETAAQARQNRQKAHPFDVAIAGVATAVPKHKLSQDDIAERAKAVFPHLARLEGLYTNTGIETRYACQPKEWYYERHGWEARTEVFQRHALQLLEEVTLAAIADAGIALEGHRRARGEHHHRARHSEPRRQADESARFSALDGALADLRARLRRRRGRALARRALRAGHAGRARAVPDHRPLQPVPPHRRSEPGDVRLGGAVRRRCRRSRLAQCGQGRVAMAAERAASSPWAIISGPTPSASWAGTSRRTASAWC